MIEIIINEVKEDISNVNPSWIHDQIRSREKIGETVCVRILIKTSSMDIALSTPACPSSGGGGGRKLTTPDEQRVFALWDKFDLNCDPINSGKLNAFLQQVE